MTNTTRTLIRSFALTVAVAAATVGVSTASFAYSAEQQRLCTGDAFRLCGSEIPNVDRITVCMRKQRSSLSVGCRSVFDK